MFLANLNWLLRWALALTMVASAVGCCASPYRAWQNAYGFEDPQIEHYMPGPREGNTTPPGPTTPASVRNIASTSP